MLLFFEFSILFLCVFHSLTARPFEARDESFPSIYADYPGVQLDTIIETSANTIKGQLFDETTGDPVAFANIGILNENVGTLSDPDGTFELIIPSKLSEAKISISHLGYEGQTISLTRGSKLESLMRIRLAPFSNQLDEVVLSTGESYKKIKRLGWVNGKDGILPFDTLRTGGAVAAILLEAPKAPFMLDEVQIRLMYNSNESMQLRLHIYAYDSVSDQPGKELLSREIMLEESKRFGWLRYDMSGYQIEIDHKKFYLGFEWITTQKNRSDMAKGLDKYDAWKADEYKKGNSKVSRVVDASNGDVRYDYKGNMMNWPGFDSLPPWTALMIQKGKQEKTSHLRTFERKNSFGQWKEFDGTLNAVAVIKY